MDFGGGTIAANIQYPGYMKLGKGVQDQLVTGGLIAAGVGAAGLLGYLLYKNLKKSNKKLAADLVKDVPVAAKFDKAVKATVGGKPATDMQLANVPKTVFGMKTNTGRSEAPPEDFRALPKPMSAYDRAVKESAEASKRNMAQNQRIHDWAAAGAKQVGAEDLTQAKLDNGLVAKLAPKSSRFEARRLQTEKDGQPVSFGLGYDAMTGDLRPIQAPTGGISLSVDGMEAYRTGNTYKLPAWATQDDAVMNRIGKTYSLSEYANSNMPNAGLLPVGSN